MNILFVIANLGVGGAQSFLLRMLSAFPKEHNIYLYDVHPKQREKEILTNLTKKIPVFSSKYERFELKLQNYPKIFTKILNRLNHYFNIKNRIDKKYFNQILNKKNIQIINSHMYLADSFVYNNCDMNIPKISTFHGCYNLLYSKKKTNFYDLQKEVAYIFNNYSGIIFIADKQKQIFNKIINIPNLRFVKIYNGSSDLQIKKIDLKQKYKLSDKSFIFGMVARGDITKGWQEAIDAFKMLQKEYKHIYLILSGGTDYLIKIEEKYSNNKNIIFTGNINNPLDYISNYDVGLLPTYFPAESLPNTVIEYLYCGKPIIATNWAEIPKMIEYNKEKAGEIIPLINGKADVNKLYLAMKSYIENPEKIKIHSSLAKQAFSKFEMQKCINSYIDFFEKIK